MQTDVSGTTAPRVGVIGLGTMGAGMARRLLECSVPLAVHNRTAAAAAPFGERGADVATSPAELAAGVDVVVVSVSDRAAAEAVVFGEDGVAAGLSGSTVVLDTCTVEPDYARERARRLRSAGHGSLDACVVGNGAHAESGELRFLLGGAPAVADRVAPVLDVLGKDVTHVGDDGAGATLKLVLNMLMGVQMEAMAEAVVLGERAGLSRDAVLGAISASGFSSPVMRFKAGVMGRRAFERADFRLALMRKDLALVRSEAQRLGVSMAVAEAAYATATTALHDGLGDADCAGILVHLERLAGLAPR